MNSSSDKAMAYMRKSEETSLRCKLTHEGRVPNVKS